jgi:hypothetical protein
MAKDKQVATGGDKKSREESFGSRPGSVSIAGGTMAKFGYTQRDEVWPPSPTSVDQKTGYPKGFQNETKSVKGMTGKK